MSALGRIAKRGERFSRNAVTPSRASAERPMYSERATRPASQIPQPDESSTAIVHRRPRGSQDAACSEHAAHQGGPSSRARGAGGARAGLEFDVRHYAPGLDETEITSRFREGFARKLAP